MPGAALRGAAGARLAGPEDGIARRLRDLLRLRGLDAGPPEGGGQGRAALPVGRDRGRIAIECRLAGPGRKGQAARDAAGMPAAAGRADAAFAIVCPPGCSEGMLRSGTALEVCIVDGHAAGDARGRWAPCAGGPGDQDAAALPRAQGGRLAPSQSWPTAHAASTGTPAIPTQSPAGSATRSTPRCACSPRRALGTLRELWDRAAERRLAAGRKVDHAHSRVGLDVPRQARPAPLGDEAGDRRAHGQEVQGRVESREP